MSNILVTGANGFIGSHLVNHLKKDNKVVSLIHSYLPGKWFEEALEGSIVIDCDVRDHDSLRRILARYEIDKVYHTAAISLVKTAFRDPLGVYDVNTMGTVALLEACRLVGTKRILVMNTDKVYGEGLDATEDKRYQHSEPYATSKICQGYVVLSYIDTYNMNIVMSHACNVFGYDPMSNRIMPNVIKKCIQGKSPLIFTNDNTIREYVYIDDALRAFQELMDDENHLGSRNISTGWVYNQKDIVVKILENFSGLEPKYMEVDLPAQIEVQSLKSIRWDWKPKFTFEKALSATVEQFKKYQSDWI